MSVRDFQRSALYKWEVEHIAPKDTSSVNIAIATAIVNYVWECEALKFPPVVEQLPNNVKTKEGDSNRFRIRLRQNVATWVVLHETAHSLNSTIEHLGDHHGPNYLGIYIRLLGKYGNLDLPLLMYTARMAGLKFNINARYAVLDTLQS